jgi:ring-1,2-phenylacetyl-CoA epoxidase subunit PaaB
MRRSGGAARKRALLPSSSVMPGLVPGIHVLLRQDQKDVDGRDKPGHDDGTQERRMTDRNWLLWEVFIRTRNGMAHRHAGSVHAVDAAMALQNARDVYTRRGEGLSIWVVPSAAITASDPVDKDMMFEPTASKIYRHPTFYDVPDDVGHM